MPNYKIITDKTIPIFSEITDGTDTLTINNGGAVIKNYMQYKTQVGEAYLAAKMFIGVANNAYADIRVYTGSNVEPNMGMTISADGKCYITIRKDATYSASGTAVTTINLNANSSNTSSCSILYSPTISNSGTLVYETLLPAGKGSKTVGAELQSRAEVIFTPSTDYLLRVQNVSASSGDISVDLVYYEEFV